MALGLNIVVSLGLCNVSFFLLAPSASFLVGTIIHNVELHPGKGGQFARAAGTYCQVGKMISCPSFFDLVLLCCF